MSSQLRIGLIGAGLIGERRLDVAKNLGLGRPVWVYDTNDARAKLVADKTGAKVARDSDEVISSADVDIVIVATPNHLLAELGERALRKGKHTLLEKPGAIRPEQVEDLIKAQEKTKRVCKIGYNHRFHPAALRMIEEVRSHDMGPLLWIRAAYGHGGRPGYEKEWRFQRELSGGGEITDQGVHLLDLLQSCSDETFTLAHAARQSAFYSSTEEDNGFLLLTAPSGAHAQLHCSVTQWKNVFRYEVATRNGLVVWQGLGNPNYGEERLSVYRRPPEGGAPDVEEQNFGHCGMESWEAEWRHFYDACARETVDVASSARDSRWVFRILADVHEKSRVVEVKGER